MFRFLEKYGKVAHREMFNIFNMGIGMVIALDASQAEKAIAIPAEQGEKAAAARTSRLSPRPASGERSRPGWC